MVILKERSTSDEVIEGLTFSALDTEVFLKARDYYHENKDDRFKLIPITGEDGKELPFFLAFQNNMEELPPDLSAKVHLYVSDFWDYTVKEDFLDLDLLERGEVFIFDALEEYTYAIAQLIRKWYPDKYIIFRDERAAFFLERSDLLGIINNDRDFFRAYRFLAQRSFLSISSRKMGLAPYDPMQFIEKRYTSLEIMTSIFWATEIRSFGDRNPDKLFCVIKSPLGMEGLADVTRYPLYRAEIASRKRKNMVPIIDLSVPGDGNQFNGGSGENVWTMFYRQITTVPIEEVYQSKNVIFIRDQITAVNPYIQEMIYFADYGELFSKWLRFSDETLEYVTAQYDRVIPDKNARILGAVGRGTDYNQSVVTTILNKPSGPAAFYVRVKEVFEEQNYDYIFLATEDQTVFDTFLSSDLKNKILYVDQKRIDYTAKENNDQWLCDIYKRGDRDKAGENRRYLSIIYILSRCTSLIASTDCGAYLIASGLNNHKYEYVEVYDNKREVK